MFTGIVTDVGRVRAVRDTNRDRRFEVETTYDLSGVDIGASISHAGCCLTVVEKGDDWFAADASAETCGRTTVGSWQPGTRINLERSLKLGDEGRPAVGAFVLKDLAAAPRFQRTAAQSVGADLWERYERL